VHTAKAMEEDSRFIGRKDFKVKEIFTKASIWEEPDMPKATENIEPAVT